MKTRWEGRVVGVAQRYICTQNIDARRRWVLKAARRTLYPRETNPGAHCTGGSVGPQGCSEVVRKTISSPGFESLTVKPIASC